MSVATDDVFTTASIAERLGVDQVTVGRWAREWTGGQGSGHHYALTLVDLLVARAWQVINGEYPAEGACQSAPFLRDLAETAIRDRPQRWLLLAAGFAMTFDTAEAGAAGWLVSGWPAATLIDLWSTPQGDPVKRVLGALALAVAVSVSPFDLACRTSTTTPVVVTGG